MSLIVQKFGGTSVGSVERIEQVAEKVAKFRRQGHDVVVVVSAMSGETNRLIELAHQVQERPVPREMDVLISTGEQVTTALLSMALDKRGVKARSYTGGQVRILTDDAHTKARIREIDDQRLHASLAEGYVLVVAGFQGADGSGEIRTLGRGGSDTSAVALGAALGADEVEIFTDVPGVATCDPRRVPEARFLAELAAPVMLAMAEEGSKVLHPRAVRASQPTSTALRVLSTFDDTPGTLVHHRPLAGDARPVALAHSEAASTVSLIHGGPLAAPVALALPGAEALTSTAGPVGVQRWRVPEGALDAALRVLHRELALPSG